MTVAKRAMIALATLSLTATVLGAAVLVMLAPAYTRALVLWAGAPERSGLSVEETLHHAEEVRAYVAGATDIELAGRLDDGRPAFDAWAVSHLADVRDVIAGVRVATGAAAVFSIGWIVWALGGHGSRKQALAASLTAAAWAILITVTLGATFALLDFDRFFTLFHAVFFEVGTWVFPEDALLIRLFPERFWMASGGAWAGLSLSGAGAMVLGALAARTGMPVTKE